jgi:hypothetical protein
MLRFTVFLILIINSAVAQPYKWKVVSQHKTDNSFFICNNSYKTINIDNLMDSVFFSSTDQITQFIKKKYSDTMYNADYKKAWRFMVDFTWSNTIPLTTDKWYHESLTFLNSAGWGFCGDKSSVLVQLWKNMGYKSRIWDLGGHEVPEVFVNNHWEVWDPTFNVYYLNEKNIPCGVEELAKNINFIKHPYYGPGIEHSPWTSLMGFSGKTGSLYQTTENNKLLDNSVDSNIVINDNFILPSKSFILFPIYSHLPLLAKFYNKSKRLTDYTNLALYIDSGWTGKITFPLIFHGIEATNASILIDTSKHYFTLKNHTYSSQTFESSTNISVIDNKTGIWVFFLMNPLLMNKNIASFYANSVGSTEDVEVKNIKLKRKNRINILYLNDIHQGLFLKKIPGWILRRI